MFEWPGLQTAHPLLWGLLYIYSLGGAAGRLHVREEKERSRG